MHKLRTLLPALALAATLHAQAHAPLTSLQDPANLAGERVSPQDPADTLPLNHGAPALQQILAKLRTRASLMFIVAHPDDEDGGLLTYESRGQGARVAMLTLTRGEGGQNLMSADFDDALGLIRTQELLAADRYFGVDQFFGTEVDFGFSKTKEEAFAKWTHDRVLYDAVRAVRLYRPLVLASVFVGGPTDGHGQHQVSGEIAQEVFLAAADPKVFPEMIQQGLLPWAPLKVYARVPFSRVTAEGMYDYATGRTIPTRFHNYVTGEDTTTVPAATVQIHEGDKPTDPTLSAAMGGDTFVQFARKGLALQKTQIGNTARLAPAGAFDAGYTLMASRLATKPATELSLFDGIDTSLVGIATLAPNAAPSLHDTLADIDHQVVRAQQLFNPAHLELAAPPLREALHMADDLIGQIDTGTLAPSQRQDLLHELRIKRVQLNNSLALALNLSIQPRVTAQNGRTGFTASDTVTADLHYSPSTSDNFLLDSLAFQPRPNLFAQGTGTRDRLSLSAKLSSDPPLTRPYFFRDNTEHPFYTLCDPALRNAPASPPSFVEVVKLTSTGAPLELRGVVRRSQPPDTVQAAEVLPALSIKVFPTVAIESTRMERPMTLTVTMSSNVPSTSGSLRLAVPPQWKVVPADTSFTLTSAAPEKTVSFILTPEGKLTPNRPYTITAVVTSAGHDYTESFRPVGYPGLPYTNFYTPATYRATAVDLQTAPNLRVAYLPGTGDPTPDFLPNLGITPTMLTLKDLTPATLNQYDAVLVGVRAYAALPALAGPGSQPLLDYAKQGGVVILQYMTARFGDAEAPFPISVPGDSAHNVVEEAQPVTLLHPDAPLLTWPNRITSADFDHWVAERGHGFAATWSPSYTPLLETHDLGQDPQQGGLLLARTGKGAYIYCALALYRQFPEGVPGAYRLLANLLSLAKNPAYQAH